MECPILERPEMVSAVEEPETMLPCTEIVTDVSPNGSELTILVFLVKERDSPILIFITFLLQH